MSWAPIMENVEALKWAAIYMGLWIVAGIVGAGIAAIGVAIGGLATFGAYNFTPLALRYALYPRGGAALIVLGLLVWKFGSVALFFKTVTTAQAEESAKRFDTEAIKSDILSVLDDRLSDMHNEITQTRQQVDRMGQEDAASGFEFPDE